MYSVSHLHRFNLANLNQRTHDVASLKPKGRGVYDLSKNKEKNVLPESSPKLISFKSYIQIATLNVRTIRTSDKIYEIANNFNKCKLSISIVVAVFNGNPNTTIVVKYAPIEGSKEAEGHYNNLINLINNIPKHHMVI